MQPGTTRPRAPLCPSSPPLVDGGVTFGVVGGTADEPRVGYLSEVLPITDELLALSTPVSPTEVFRFAAPCAESACRHFDGTNCRLVARTVQLLPLVVNALPPCRLRPHCRWWQQEGKAACLRCPQVVTELHQGTDVQRRVADPNYYE